MIRTLLLLVVLLCPGAAFAQTYWVGDFLDSLGMNTHMTQGDSPTLVSQEVGYLGIHNLRDYGNHGVATPFITVFNATGVKFDLFMEHPETDLNSARILAGMGALTSIEGPNEPNNFAVTFGSVNCGGAGQKTWLPCAQLQQSLYATVKADTVLKNYPVLNISEVGAEPDNVGLQYNQIPTPAPLGVKMPAGTRYSDYLNDHNYFIGNCHNLVDNLTWGAAGDTIFNCTDGLYWEHILTWAGRFPGYDPTKIEYQGHATTESGWGTGGAFPLTQDLQGKWALNFYLSQFARHFRWSYFYELQDGSGGDTGQAGVFDNTGVPKLAATYIHNLTTILANSGPKPASLTQMNWGTTVIPTVHSFTLEKSDGSLWLVVWDERATATDKVNVTFNGVAHNYNLYDPTQSATPIGAGINATSIALGMSNHPLIIQITK